MGFVATEKVEALTYDFNPYAAVSGTIPEPTTRQVEDFRRAMFRSIEGLGLSAEDFATGKIGFEQVGQIMEKAGEVEQSLLDAVADLTGIANSVLNALPYRVKAAFSGYIVGVFLRPEASTPATT